MIKETYNIIINIIIAEKFHFEHIASLDPFHKSFLREYMMYEKNIQNNWIK